MCLETAEALYSSSLNMNIQTCWLNMTFFPFNFKAIFQANVLKKKKQPNKNENDDLETLNDSNDLGFRNSHAFSQAQWLICKWAVWKEKPEWQVKEEEIICFPKGTTDGAIDFFSFAVVRSFLFYFFYIFGVIFFCFMFYTMQRIFYFYIMKRWKVR